ncbi:MAG TPA: hypothetical protein VGR08_10675 [Thermomicrobiales bacterium]|nr:hypothetical protein [Thermomicrobiales bacterium]
MHCPAPSPAPGFKRLIFLAAALGLLAMPVEYRGGAEGAHPHAVIQFWAEAGRGSLSHHHRDGSHHRDFEGAREIAADEIAYHATGEADFPRLFEATTSQKYAPIAVAIAGVLFTVVLTTRAQRSHIAVKRPKGMNPMPTVPPPRLSRFA